MTSILTYVLLPGLHGTPELFEPFCSAAPKGTRLILVDYPPNEASFDSLEHYARKKLTDRCVVVAESFSGPIGVRIADDDRVQALILCNSFISNPHSPLLRYLSIARLFAFPVPAFLIRMLLSGHRGNPELIKAVQAALRRLPASVVARRLHQVLQADERKTVHSLRKPILYLRGLDDRLISERSWRELLESRTDAQIVQIAGPHMLLQVSPHKCWQEIIKFTGRLSSEAVPLKPQPTGQVPGGVTRDRLQRDAIALLARAEGGMLGAQEFVNWAVQALVAGSTSSALIKLAALDLESSPRLYDALPMFHETLLELGIILPDSREDLLRAHGQELARQITVGILAPSEGVARMEREVLSPLNHPADLLAWCHLHSDLHPDTLTDLKGVAWEEYVLELAKTGNIAQPK